MAGGKVFNDLNGDGLYEVSTEVMDAVTSDYFIEGKNVFIAHNSVLYSASEIRTFSTITQPYRTQTSKAYDAAANSISIGIGDKFDLGNGHILTVGTNSILGEGYGNGRIREVGNTSVVPSSIYNAAVNRYEENLYQPLSEMLKGRTGEEA